MCAECWCYVASGGRRRCPPRASFREKVDDTRFKTMRGRFKEKSIIKARKAIAGKVVHKNRIRSTKVWVYQGRYTNGGI